MFECFWPHVINTRLDRHTRYRGNFWHKGIRQTFGCHVQGLPHLGLLALSTMAGTVANNTAQGSLSTCVWHCLCCGKAPNTRHPQLHDQGTWFTYPASRAIQDDPIKPSSLRSRSRCGSYSTGFQRMVQGCADNSVPKGPI